MSFASLVNTWSCTTPYSRAVIVTDNERLNLAAEIQRDIAGCTVINITVQTDYMDTLYLLDEQDLVIVLLSIDSFIHKKLNGVFSPFKKPTGFKAKYIFIRLDITKQSLLEGLSTPLPLIEDTIDRLIRIPQNSQLRVTNSDSAGTDITLTINKFKVLNYLADTNDKAAFLPPSEIYAGILPQSTNGKIVVDVTIGQLIERGRCLGEFGLVDEPTTLIIQNNEITDIYGGQMAKELKSKLFSMDISCRILVELGHGLSKMAPTGIIGTDESMINSCHFGIGDGTSYGIANEAPIHLDVVVSNPVIEFNKDNT